MIEIHAEIPEANPFNYDSREGSISPQKIALIIPGSFL